MYLRAAFLCLLLAAWPHGLAAQSHRATVVDQTGLPLPGVTIQLLDGERTVKTITTEADGSFAIEPSESTTVVVASLEGFEPARVPAARLETIVMELARAAESTLVVAARTPDASPAGALLGSTLTSTAVTRMPSAHMQARESLPLLPSVVRGADGLMQLGGARAYQTPLTLDGFNVTDPATGLSSLNLPIESVERIEALRDPMSMTQSGLLGGVVSLDSKPGGGSRAIGVQGFVPRPRFTSPGFGRLEGIFPRAYVSGSTAEGRVRYVTSAEFDYERIPVPDVTEHSGPDLIEQSGILFGRVDSAFNSHHTTTAEGFYFPTRTTSFGLSPRRSAEASVNLGAQDLFGGVTHRMALDAGLFTLRASAYSRVSRVFSRGTGRAVLSADGWEGNWFADASRSAQRYAAAASWDRSIQVGEAIHDLTVTTDVSSRSLTGRVANRPVEVLGAARRLVRLVSFGPAAALRSHDVIGGVAVRDMWHAGERAQLESGFRLDHAPGDRATPSARLGLRYALDANGNTVLKAGAGTFVGTVPLAASAFAAYPTRMEQWFSEEDGRQIGELTYRPAATTLQLPQARTFTLGLERQLLPGVDVQAIATDRDSWRLATLDVPAAGGDLRVLSNGRAHYRELQLSMRRTWAGDQMLFVSYVRSAATGELNEFAGLFQQMDTPLVQPGGEARTANDARNRVLAWGTFNLPRRTVVSPVTEWRSGFPYSSFTSRYIYQGIPNDRAFPRFVSVDLVAYKTVTVHRRSADLGIQVFNLTGHHNFRDVYPVVGAPRFGQFANSVGRIFRGYMLLKW